MHVGVLFNAVKVTFHHPTQKATLLLAHFFVQRPPVHIAQYRNCAKSDSRRLSIPKLPNALMDDVVAHRSCMVCFEENLSKDQSLRCTQDHSMCLLCADKYMLDLVARHSTRMKCAFSECAFDYDTTDLCAALPPKTFRRVMNVSVLMKNAKKRECPNCASLNEKRHGHNLHCTSCGCDFCSEHG